MIGLPRGAGRVVFTVFPIGTAGREAMIGRGVKKRETLTDRPTKAAAAHRIERKAAEEGHLDVGQESPAILPSKTVTVPIGVPAAGEAVLPEAGAVFRGRLVPMPARAGATDRAVGRNLRGQNQGLQVRIAAPVRGKTIAGDLGGLPEAARLGVVLGATGTGAQMHEAPVGGQAAKPGRCNRAQRTERRIAVRGLPGAALLGELPVGGRIGALVQAIVPAVVAN